MSTDLQAGPGRLNRRAAALFSAVGAAASRWPWYLQVLAVWALARGFSFLVLSVVAAQQRVSPWGQASPSYLEFVDIWDSQWYERVFDGGYPTSIPRDGSGTAQENEWAFYALFPLVVRGLDALTGLGWTVLATTVATAAGFGGALVIYLLFRLRAGAGTSLWAVTFTAVSPVSPVFQIPYAESLNLLLLAAALYLVVSGRYLAAIPVVVLMCLSRPVGVAFALGTGVLFLVSWFRRHTVPFPPEKAWRLFLLVGVSGASALAWPAIAWAYTGDPGAYTDTETAWRGSGLLLFKPWFNTSEYLFGPVMGPVAVLVLAACLVLYLNSAAVRRLGLELQLWCSAYILYLLAFLNPFTSTFRLLIPLFPLALPLVWISKSKAYRTTVVVAFLLLQIVWTAWLWRWTELPGGGDYPP